MADDTNTDGATLDIEPTASTTPSRFDTPEAGDATSAAVDKAHGAAEVVKDQAASFGGQAGDRIRAFADDGKARATGALGELAKAIEDAAGTIDDKVGVQFGGYARTASTAVSDFSQKLENTDIDDLVADARDFVRKSPGIAIGGAAAIGFVLARVLWAGVDANRDA